MKHLPRQQEIHSSQDLVICHHIITFFKFVIKTKDACKGLKKSHFKIQLGSMV